MTAIATVLLIHQSSEMYGSDRVLLYLAKGLQAAGQFHPVVVLPDEGPLLDALRNKGIEVHVGAVAKISRATFTPRGLIRLARQTYQAVRFLDQLVGNRDVGLVHSNTLAVLSGAIWASLRRIPHLWHVHEIVLSPALVRKGFPYLVSYLSDRVMSNSTLTERWLLSEQPGLARRSVVVFNGLPLPPSTSASAISHFRDSIGAAASDVVVTLAGRINRWKGQGLLLDAAATLTRRISPVKFRFVIIGGPAPGLEYLLDTLKTQAIEAGIAEQCSFIPFAEDIWPIWFGTDIAVVPSTEPEPFGMVAIEAMTAGVPVVAAAHGGLLDIVVDGETGILFPPRDTFALADAIERLASDAALRRRMGAAGAERQRALFSVETQVEKTTQVYKEMMK